MTSKDAKQYLERIKTIETIVQNKKYEKLQYRELTRELATSITPSFGSDRVQSSGSKQRMANVIEGGVDFEREVDNRIKELVAEKNAIIETIERLPEDKYDILHKVYVQHMTLKEVASCRGESYSLVTTNHGVALSLLAELLCKTV